MWQTPGSQGLPHEKCWEPLMFSKFTTLKNMFEACYAQRGRDRERLFQYDYKITDIYNIPHVDIVSYTVTDIISDTSLLDHLVLGIGT